MIKRKQRIPMRDLETMTAEDRTTVEKNAMNGQVFNIFKVLAHHPALVKRWTPFEEMTVDPESTRRIGGVLAAALRPALPRSTS